MIYNVLIQELILEVLEGGWTLVVSPSFSTAYAKLTDC